MPSSTSRKRKAEADDAPYQSPSKRHATHTTTPPRMTRAARKRLALNGGDSDAEEHAKLDPGLPMPVRERKPTNDQPVKKEEKKKKKGTSTLEETPSSSTASSSFSSSPPSSASFSPSCSSCLVPSKVDTADKIKRAPIDIAAKVPKQSEPPRTPLPKTSRKRQAEFSRQDAPRKKTKLSQEVGPCTPIERTFQLLSSSISTAACSDGSPLRALPRRNANSPPAALIAHGPAPVAYMGGFGEEEPVESPIHIKIEPVDESEQTNSFPPALVPLSVASSPSSDVGCEISPKTVRTVAAWIECVKDEFVDVPPNDGWNFDWEFPTTTGHDRLQGDQTLPQIVDIEAAAAQNDGAVVAAADAIMHMTGDVDTDDRVTGQVVKTASTVSMEETPSHTFVRTEFGTLIIPAVPRVSLNEADGSWASQDLTSDNLACDRPLPAFELEKKEVRPASPLLSNMTVEEVRGEAQASGLSETTSDAPIVARAKLSSVSHRDLRVTIEDVSDEDLIPRSTRSPAPSPSPRARCEVQAQAQAQTQTQLETANPPGPRVTIEEALDEILAASAPAVFEEQAQALSPSVAPSPASNSSPDSSPAPYRFQTRAHPQCRDHIQAVQAQMQAQMQALIQAHLQPRPCPSCPPPAPSAGIQATVARFLNDVQARIDQRDDPMDIVQPTTPRSAGLSAGARDSDVLMRDAFNSSESDVVMRDADSSSSRRSSKSDVVMRDRSPNVCVETEDAPPRAVVNNMTLQETNALLRLQLQPGSSASSLGRRLVTNDEWPYTGRSMTAVWEDGEGTVEQDGQEQMVY